MARVQIFSGPMGHLSIGEAVTEAVFDFDPEHLSLPGSRVGFYSLIYRYFPNAWKLPFKLSHGRTARRGTLAYARRYYAEEVSRVLKKNRPQVIVSSWFIASLFLEKYLDSGQTLINVVSDPRTFSKLCVAMTGYNLVFDRQAALECSRTGCDNRKIIKTGWFVRNRFEEKYEKEKVRKELGLEGGVLTVLVAGGSEGASAVLKVLPAFVKSPGRVQAIFACGTNEKLFRAVLKLKSVARGVSIVPIKFTPKIDLYMKAADLVVGKAGPNFLFESVATGTPFLAITHIPGQEDGNLEVICEYELGMVEEKTVAAIRTLRQIIRSPEILDQFASSVAKMARYNRGSKQILRDLVEEILEKKLFNESAGSGKKFRKR